MKTITKQKWLEAFAFYTLACRSYEDCCAWERALAKSIGSNQEFDDNFRDAIFGNAKPPPFEEALAAAGYISSCKASWITAGDCAIPHWRA